MMNIFLMVVFIVTLRSKILVAFIFCDHFYKGVKKKSN